MHSLASSIVFSTLSAALLAAAVIPAVPVLASTGEILLAQASAPSAAESDFWRSTERLDTEDAYKAYLAAFPNGFYAPLARAALTKLQAKSGATADAPGRLLQLPRSQAAKLQAYSKAATSQAVKLDLGMPVSGPAVVQIGFLGSRKQLVLPSGEWVVLSAVDHAGTTTFSSINVNATNNPQYASTVVFGKFVGSRLVAMLSFTANTRAAHSTAVYTDAEDCQKSSASRLHEWRNMRAAVLQQCIQVNATTQPIRRGSAADGEVANTLKQLGAEVDGLAIASDIFFTDRSHGYLRITRTDWPLGISTNPADWEAGTARSDSVRLNYLTTLTAWLERYRPYAKDGFGKDLDVTQVQQGSPVLRAVRITELQDFDPFQTAR